MKNWQTLSATFRYFPPVSFIHGTTAAPRYGEDCFIQRNEGLRHPWSAAEWLPGSLYTPRCLSHNIYFHSIFSNLSLPHLFLHPGLRYYIIPRCGPLGLLYFGNLGLRKVEINFLSILTWARARKLSSIYPVRVAAVLSSCRETKKVKNSKTLIFSRLFKKKIAKIFFCSLK